MVAQVAFRLCRPGSNPKALLKFRITVNQLSLGVGLFLKQVIKQVLLFFLVHYHHLPL